MTNSNNALPTISYLRNPSYTNGIVVKMKERNSIDADLSFDYYIEYNVNGARYQLIHTKSINPAKYDIGDTVIVKFSSRKPNYSTAHTDWHQYNSLLYALIIFLAFMFSIMQYAKFLKK